MKKKEKPYNPEFVAMVQKGLEQIKRGETRIVYSSEFVAMIKQGDKDLKDGKGVKIDIGNLWK
jgi:hypothetical protein